MKFKLWLENDENINLLQKLEPSSTNDKASESLKTKFAEFMNSYEEALRSEHISKDQYKKLKEKFEEALQTSAENKFQDFAREYRQQQANNVQQKKKELEDQGAAYDINDLYRITDPYHLFINELLFANYGQKFKILSKKSNEKFINALPDDIKEACMEIKEYAENYLKFKKVIDDLKSKVKSVSELRSMKKTEVEEKKKRDYFLKPLASRNAMAKLEKSIDDLLTENKENFIREEKQRLLRVADNYFNEFENEPNLDVVKAGKILFANRVDKLFSIDYRNKTLERKPDYEMIADKLAKDQWDSMSQFFKFRMISKISPIVDKKAAENNDFVMEIIRFNTARGILEGEFSFKFTDNSSFFVKHQVVGKLSVGGIYFNQFPTHFRNITTADGTFYNFLPEDQMYPKFVNIAAPRDSSDA